jgi:tRNA 2-thiouridine synthesizing protein A
MSKEIRVDAKGLSCPIPVVQTKKAIESARPGDTVVTVVDNEASRDNVSRMARGRGCAVETEGSPGEFRVRIRIGAGARETGANDAPSCAVAKPEVVAYVNSDVMGSGSRELGAILMKAFLQTLKDADPKPDTVVFVNAGVHLTTEGSKVLPILQNLEKTGTGVVSCGTCLDFFHRIDKVQVGIVSNMYEIVNLLTGADRVVTP